MLDVFRDPDAVLALGLWAYVVLAVAVAVDSVVPVVPSEVLAIAAGAFVAKGALDARLVVPAVVAGGVFGDLATYHVGRAGSRRALHTMSATPRRRQLFDRLQRSLSRRRTATIIAARFVPGGRTGVGLLAGVTRQPRPAFLGASLLGVTLWALYVLGLGFVTGRSADNIWVSVGVGVAVASLVSGAAALGGRRERGDDRIVTLPDEEDAMIAA